MNIRRVYDNIAEGFYHLRQRPIISEIYEFAKKWKPGLLLDIGSGIGSDSLPFAKNGFDCICLDISGKMLKLAKKFEEKKRVKFILIEGDCVQLPFKSNSFNYIISISCFHHLEKNHLQAFKEVKRVLKPNGIGLITVWNKEQERFKEKPKELKIPWTHKGKKFYRYYYLFTKDEFQILAKKSGLKIIKTFSNKNICLLVKKSG